MAKFTITIEDSDEPGNKSIIVNSVSDPDIDLIKITEDTLSVEEIEALNLTPAQQLGANLTMAINMFKKLHTEESAAVEPENTEEETTCEETCSCH